MRKVTIFENYIPLWLVPGSDGQWRQKEST